MDGASFSRHYIDLDNYGPDYLPLIHLLYNQRNLLNHLGAHEQPQLINLVSFSSSSIADSLLTLNLLSLPM